MILNLTYGSATYLKVVNYSYDDVAHTVTAGSVGETVIPSGVGPGIEVYRQDIVGGYYSVRVQDASPFAYVVFVEVTVAEDLSIDSVAIVSQYVNNSGVPVLGSVTVTASGTGTKRYFLGYIGPQVSNVFPNLMAGQYLLVLSRTEDDYTVSQLITVPLIPNLEITASKVDCSANAIDDGQIELTIENGSGDYSVDFITEAVVVPLAGVPISETRTNLAPDTYEIEVTDNITGQIRNTSLVIAYPTVVVEVPLGTVFSFPLVNSISFVVPDENPQQLDNVLFADQVHPGMEEACYHQPFNLSDQPPIQFKSNFQTHVAKLFKYSDDTEVKQFPVSLTEENLDTTIDFELIIKDYGVPDQSKIYFQSGTIPIPLAVGNNFEISNNADGFNGVYQILAILVEASTGLKILVINLDYTAGGASSSATGTFDNQLADYNVYEIKPDFSDVAPGKYYITVTASDPSTKVATSEPIDLRVAHTGTQLIVYSNTDNDFDTIWSTGYRGLVRIKCGFGAVRKPGGERSFSRNSNDSPVKINARKRRFVPWFSDLMPGYMVEKLSVIFDCDFFSINGLPFQSSEGLGSDYPEKSRLALTSIMLEQLNWFGKFKSNKDMPTETESCACDVVDQKNVSSAPSTISLNMQNKVSRIFRLTGTISGDKTIALLNDTLALVLKFYFTTDAACVITFPSTFKMSDSEPRWTDADKEFDANIPGDYSGEAVWDGTYFRMTLNN